MIGTKKRKKENKKRKKESRGVSTNRSSIHSFFFFFLLFFGKQREFLISRFVFLGKRTRYAVEGEKGEGGEGKKSVAAIPIEGKIVRDISSLETLEEKLNERARKTKRWI